MTKIKNTTTRKTGTSAVSQSGKAAEGRKSVFAKRAGVEREFPFLTWSMLPPDKEGWVEIEAKPADIPTLDEKAGEVKGEQSEDKQPTEARLSALRAYADLFGNEPEGELSTNQIKKMVSDKQKELENMDDHIITQDDLDQNPELAKQKYKVGDVLKVEKKGDQE